MQNKPVLLARIAMIASVVLPFLLGSSSILSNIVSVLCMAVLFYSLQKIGLAYQKPSISKNYAISAGLILITLVVNMAVIAPESAKIGTQFLGMESATYEQAMQELQRRIQEDNRIGQDVVMFIVNKTSLLPYFGIVFLLYLVSIVFYRFAFAQLGKSTGIKHFSTGSLLMIIGIPTILVLGLGFILMFVGWIFILVGFFTLTDEQISQQ